jgi:hypothetical protein
MHLYFHDEETSDHIGKCGDGSSPSVIGDVPEGDTSLYFFIYSEKRVSPQGMSPYYPNTP